IQPPDANEAVRDCSRYAPIAAFRQRSSRTERTRVDLQSSGNAAGRPQRRRRTLLRVRQADRMIEDSSVDEDHPCSGRSSLVHNVSVRVDVYIKQGCKAKLTMHPGAIQAFDRAIIVAPSFALAHTAKPH